MKEKDFYEVVSAIAQFIEKADNETGRGAFHPPEGTKTEWADSIRPKSQNQRG